MSKQITVSGEIVRSYLEKFPDSPSKTLANLIYKENKTVFNTPETVRSAIRRLRGASGDIARAEVTDKSHFRPHRTGADSFKKLPAGLTTLDNWKIVKITGNHNALILSDTHIPYYNKMALGLAVDKADEFDIDLVILNGDWADHFSISRWQKDPRQRNFPEEIKTVVLSLEWIREVFPKARIVYKLGNHEERFQNYMELKAPELLGIPDFELYNVFKLKDYDIELVDEKKPIKLNELFVIHGHEYSFNISNPVNPARGLFLRAKVNAICGHFHQSSAHSENNIEDKFTGCWSMGHLGEEHPKYMPLNKWNLGFAIVEMSGIKHFQVHNYKIMDNEVFRA